MANTYQDLIVWQKAMDLVVSVYVCTKKFPKEEQYGLVSQMRRCAVSIPSNIAEGKMRGSSNEFRRFLFISFGSGAELETQVQVAKKLQFGEKEDLDKIKSELNEVMKMLNKLISQLEPSA